MLSQQGTERTLVSLCGSFDVLIFLTTGLKLSGIRYHDYCLSGKSVCDNEDILSFILAFYLLPGHVLHLKEELLDGLIIRLTSRDIHVITFSELCFMLLVTPIKIGS